MKCPDQTNPYGQKNRSTSCQAQGEGNQWGVNANGFGVSYWDNKNALVLYSGDNCITL